MKTIVILGGMTMALIVLIIWAACMAGRRADDDLDRYLAKQQEEARNHGCATRTTAAKT